MPKNTGIVLACYTWTNTDTKHTVEKNLDMATKCLVYRRKYKSKLFLWDFRKFLVFHFSGEFRGKDVCPLWDPGIPFSCQNHSEVLCDSMPILSEKVPGLNSTNWCTWPGFEKQPRYKDFVELQVKIGNVQWLASCVWGYLLVS